MQYHQTQIVKLLATHGPMTLRKLNSLANDLDEGQVFTAVWAAIGEHDVQKVSGNGPDAIYEVKDRRYADSIRDVILNGVSNALSSRSDLECVWFNIRSLGEGKSQKTRPSGKTQNRLA